MPVIDAWRRWPLADREREYSPSSMLALLGTTIDAELRRYADGTLVAQLQHQPRTVGYGDDPSELVDVYEPTSGRSRSTMIFIHGGYWQQLRRDESAWFVTPLLESGWAVCVVDYELAPARSVAGIVDQVVRACEFVADNELALGLSGPLVVAGSSAGAHLAAHAVGGVAQLTGAVLLSGIFDLRPLVGTTINKALSLDNAAAAELSVTAAMLGAPRQLVIAAGQHDTAEFLRQSAELAADAERAGHTVTHVVVDGRHHFDLPDAMAEANGPLGRAIARLQGSPG